MGQKKKRKTGAKKTAKRVPIPQSLQTAILLANRHACCVCQKNAVQLHHIDSNPSNNVAENLAALCMDHHDRATMQVGLTKKLKPEQVTVYKAQWESKCKADIAALSRNRFVFLYCIYKNPQRLLGLYLKLSDDQRKSAIRSITGLLTTEQEEKSKDQFFGINLVPQHNGNTWRALKSIYAGENYPSYLGKYAGHPGDASYPYDFSSQDGMIAFHQYDLWCQVMAQTLAAANGTLAFEDLLRLKPEKIDGLAGNLVSFQLSITGKGIKHKHDWQTHPVGIVSSRHQAGGRKFKTQMPIRTMYIFSDTAVINLRQGRVAGLGVLGGTEVVGSETLVSIHPLIIGSGGRTLYPKEYGIEPK